MRHFLLVLQCIIFCSNNIISQPGELYEESGNEYSANGWGFGLSDLQVTMQSWMKYPVVRIDTIGYSVEERPMYRISVMKNGKITDQRYRIAIHARTHPAEVQSSYVTNAIIHTLISNSDLAKKLLNSCIFNIVPMYNVDGVEDGYARTNVHGVDIEGDWSLENPEKEVATLRSVYKTYMNSKIPVNIALNMHSALACKRYFVFHAEQGTSAKYTELEKNFINGIRSYFPEGIENWNYNITWTTSTPQVYPESWFWVNYKESVMALTYEDMNCESAGNYDLTANAILNGISDYLGLNNSDEIYAGNSQLLHHVSAYPNPVSQAGNLAVIVPENGNYNVKLISLGGTVLIQKNISSFENKIVLTIPECSAGLYLIGLVNSDNYYQIRILVK
jgi:hypothetical protein